MENDYFNVFTERLSSYTDLEIIAAFNREVENPGWNSARAAYLAAIRKHFDLREIDITAIENNNSISYAKKISFFKIEWQKDCTSS